MGKIYSTRDVQAFHMMLTVRCGEPKPTNSQFGYHAHRRLCFVHFACEMDGKINFNHIYL